MVGIPLWEWVVSDKTNSKTLNMNINKEWADKDHSCDKTIFACFYLHHWSGFWIGVVNVHTLSKSVMDYPKPGWYVLCYRDRNPTQHIKIDQDFAEFLLGISIEETLECLKSVYPDVFMDLDPKPFGY